MPSASDNDRDCREAAEEIIEAMNNEDAVVIFAGHTEEMQPLVSENLFRRVIKLFYFDDYSPTDIATILHRKIEKQDEDSFAYGFVLHPVCTVEAISGLIMKHVTEEKLEMLNGSLVDPWLVSALENMNLRVDMGATDARTLLTITMEDLEEGIKSIA